MPDIAVVFVPGICGSELICKGNLIWPGALAEYFGPYKHMSEMTSLATVERNVIRHYTPFISVYDKILKHLDQVLPGRVFECPYDWRRSNDESARKLSEKVREAAQSHAEVVIVAHSMGGLVARHYLESGQFSGEPGYAKVSTLITLATPHYGSPFALTAALGFEKEQFLSSDQVYDLVNRSDFPSLYQLLPPRQIPFVWHSEPGLQPFDVYGASAGSVEGVGGRRLNTTNIASAARFWQTIQTRADVRYFCFLGTQEWMMNSVYLEQNGGQLTAVKPKEIADAGDGTVPSWSAVLDHAQSMPVGGDHLGMLGDDALHNTLDQVLGIPPIRPLQLPFATLSISRPVVETSSLFLAKVRFTTADPIVNGSIHIEPQPGYALPQATVSQLPVEMSGPRSMCLEIPLRAPEVPSVYRVTWSERDKVLASKSVIVQSTQPLSDAVVRQFESIVPKE